MVPAMVPGTAISATVDQRIQGAVLPISRGRLLRSKFPVYTRKAGRITRGPMHANSRKNRIHPHLYAVTAQNLDPRQPCSTNQMIKPKCIVSHRRYGLSPASEKKRRRRLDSVSGACEVPGDAAGTRRRFRRSTDNSRADWYRSSGRLCKHFSRIRSSWAGAVGVYCRRDGASSFRILAIVEGGVRPKKGLVPVAIS